MVGKNKKIVVGLSGGVDSSAALILLKKQGWQPIGLSLKYSAWQNQENICCSPESFAQAAKVCAKLKVPYHILDCHLQFESKVIAYFKALLKKKQTPSPCLICNRDLKFERLFSWAKSQQIDYVASGHHAQIKLAKKSGLYQLVQAKDKAKDQSYFLCLLDQAKLAKLVFPVGQYLKEDIYKLVQEYGFGFYQKVKQSQDLCFVDSESKLAFLEQEIGFQPGPIKDLAGRQIGQHQGLHFYTIGQRKGLDLRQGPWWVVALEPAKNTLIVTNQKNDSSQYQSVALLEKVHLISGQPLKKPILVRAKVRSSQDLKSAQIFPAKKNMTELVFKKPQKAITPGQWAVFYQQEVCLGGGIIKASRSTF